MEVNSNKLTPYIDLSTENLFEIPITSEPVQDQLQPIITNVHSLSTETQQQPDQQQPDQQQPDQQQPDQQQPDQQPNKPRQPAEPRLKCPECSRYTAADQDQLTRHIRKVHRGENPFQCFMCDYSTYNKTLFEEHVRIHKGIKPYKCSFCPHRNVSKKNLQKHERIHRPDNPLKCPHCQFIARNKVSFNNHAKQYHPNQADLYLTCNWCEKKFPDQNSLVIHTTQIKSCDMFIISDNQNTDSERCDYSTCSSHKMKAHKEKEHGIDKKLRKDLWVCGLCEWSSLKKSRILLHLIHHPNQIVDESVIDVSILRKYGIM